MLVFVNNSSISFFCSMILIYLQHWIQMKLIKHYVSWCYYNMIQTTCEGFYWKDQNVIFRNNKFAGYFGQKLAIILKTFVIWTNRCLCIWTNNVGSNLIDISFLWKIWTLERLIDFESKKSRRKFHLKFTHLRLGNFLETQMWVNFCETNKI